jgi:hypothetical protein
MKNKFHFARRILAALFATVIFFSARIFAQTNSEATNGPLKLLPPYDELPPTFLEQHAESVLVGGIGLIVLAAIAIWFLFRAKSKIIIPPGVQARQALEKLRQQPEDGAMLSGVSQVVRQYFIAAFHLPQGEFTTAEFSRLVTNHQSIGAELATATTDFLRACDARKFSAASGNATFNAVDEALNLIERAEKWRAQLTSNQSGRA